MKRIGVIVMVCLFFGMVQAQEAVIWGAEVVDVSSEYSHLEYSALQALHKPNVYPAGGDNPNAWRPKKPDGGEEFVMVSFATPTRAQQVAISESENPGAVKQVLAYDTEYNEYELFNMKPRPIPIESRLLNLFFPETTYEIQAIKVIINSGAVPGFNSIDAIGVSASTLPINVLIQMTQGVARTMEAENIANVNSSYVEHSPIVSPDGNRLYFSRQYHPGNVGGVEDPEDIWVAEKDPATGEWLPARNIGPPLNNDGPNFISTISIADGKEQLILGNKYGKKGRMFQGTSTAYYEDGTYTEPESIEIENDYNYSNKSDYFLLPGGQQMILSVERDDSYGGRDLYISRKNGKVWSEPKNLGGDLNTVGEEAAPFLAEDNKTLYFSSNGYSGYGGMDIYVSRRLDDSWEKWSPPDNLGSGINTDIDDLYFSVPSTGTHVYFTRGTADDDTDIFRFKVDEFFIDPEHEIASSVQHLIENVESEKIILVEVHGKVLNQKTGEPMPNVKVSVERLPDGIDIGEVHSHDDGTYGFSLRPGARFGISAELDGYLSQDENLDLNDIKKSDSIEIDLHLTPIEVGAPIVLNNIFFAFNKWTLTTASYPELERVLEYIAEGRIKRIEISGHTDSVGSEEINQQVSERRARAVFEYFKNNGISQDRMEVKGYGESQPVESNDTKEGRDKNRRVEFKVLETGS